MCTPETAAQHRCARGQPALPVRQAAAVEIHKETVSQTGRLTGRHLAGIEADRNKHNDTGEQLHEVGGIRVRTVSTKIRQLF